MHRFWDCTVDNCRKAASIDTGGCERCRSMYCADHVQSAQHACKTEPLDDDEWLAAQTAELEALRRHTNHDALLRRARELKGGMDCHLDESDPLGRKHMGGMHVHLSVVFADGTRWLARCLRETFTSFDDALSNQILLSECATLKWLERIAEIPTPRLHGYGLRGDPENRVGVAYMLVDKLPGRPYDQYSATDATRQKVVEQWADMLSALSRHPLDKIGSLTFGEEEENSFTIGPVASDRTGTLPCIGPFDTACDYYHAWADTYRELVADRQICSGYSVDAYLIFKWLATKLQKNDGPWLKRWQQCDSEPPFFLKHTDDKGDHLLVDEQGNITGVIDWTFARAVPAYEAFAPSLFTADNDSLFSGKPGLSPMDHVLGKALSSSQKGQPLSHSYFESDEMRRLLFGLGLGLGFTHREAIDVFLGLVATFEGTAPDWTRWRQTRLAEWADDTQLARLLKYEDAWIVSMRDVLRFATCSWTDCTRPSVRGKSCPTCRKHLCIVHIQPTHHVCPSLQQLDDDAWEKSITDEVDALLAMIDVPQLVRVASKLRQGKSCVFQPGKALGDQALMGNANYHCWLLFDDGVRWLARIPRVSEFSDIPMDLIDHLIASEYATLRYLQDIHVPAPRAHAFGFFLDPDNPVGVGYILEDHMPGTPFDAYAATPEQKHRVYGQYADILGTMSRHPQQKACSPHPFAAGGVSSIASDRFLNLRSHGPFYSPEEYFVAVPDRYMNLIADGQLYIDYPKEAFLFYTLLCDRAAPVLTDMNSNNSDSLNGFFLKHVDDKGDHVLVDTDYNITAVIDWQFARFVPAIEAFGPSLFTANLDKLYSSHAGRSADDDLLSSCLRERGWDDLAAVSDSSELIRRFHFGLASGLSRTEVLDMIKAVLSLLDGEPPQDMERWVEDEWETLVDVRQAKVEELLGDLGSCK